MSSNVKPPHKPTDANYSFGMSRSQMQKMNIDRVNRDAERQNMGTSPDFYQTNKSTFQTISPMTPSIRMRRHILTSSIAKTKLPGPGSYSPQALSGNQGQKAVTSQHESVQGTRFGREGKETLQPVRKIEPYFLKSQDNFMKPVVFKKAVGIKFG